MSVFVVYYDFNCVLCLSGAWKDKAKDRSEWIKGKELVYCAKSLNVVVGCYKFIYGKIRLD